MYAMTWLVGQGRQYGCGVQGKPTNLQKKKTNKSINTCIRVFDGLEIHQVYISFGEREVEICCLLIREESGGVRVTERQVGKRKKKKAKKAKN